MRGAIIILKLMGETIRMITFPKERKLRNPVEGATSFNVLFRGDQFHSLNDRIVLSDPSQPVEMSTSGPTTPLNLPPPPLPAIVDGSPSLRKTRPISLLPSFRLDAPETDVDVFDD